MTETDYVYATHIGKYSGQVRLGTEEPGIEGMRFGEVAEVRVDDAFGKLLAEVSFPAIGSHGSEVGFRRVAVYRWACEVAAALERQIADGAELDQLLKSLEPVVRQKAVSMGLITEAWKVERELSE